MNNINIVYLKGWVPKPSSRICSLHFLPSDIANRKLSPYAVPIFTNNSHKTHHPSISDETIAKAQENVNDPITATGQENVKDLITTTAQENVNDHIAATAQENVNDLITAQENVNDHTYALPCARVQILQREFMHQTIENLVGKIHNLKRGKRDLNAKIGTLKSELCEMRYSVLADDPLELKDPLALDSDMDEMLNF